MQSKHINCASYNWNIRKRGLDQKIQLLSGHLLAIELQQITPMSTAQIICTVLDLLFCIKEILASNLFPFTISNKHQMHNTVHLHTKLNFTAGVSFC